MALGCTSPKEDAVVAAAEKICAAAEVANRRTGIFVADLNDVAFWRERGVSPVLLGSEHGFIKQGVKRLAFQNSIDDSTINLEKMTPNEIKVCLKPFQKATATFEADQVKQAL